MYIDSLECLRGNRGRRAAGFLAFLVFFVVFEKIQLLFLKYRNPAEPTCNGSVLGKVVERRRWIVQLGSRHIFLIAYFHFLLSEKYQKPLKEITSVL